MEFVKKHIITFALFLFATIGTYTWNLIEKGGEVEINEKIDARLDKKIQSPEVISKVMNSPYMIDYKRQQREELIKEALHQDSSKVKMSSYLSLKTGMTKTAVMDSLIVILNTQKRGRLVNENGCIRITKRYMRNTPIF